MNNSTGGAFSFHALGWVGVAGVLTLTSMSGHGNLGDTGTGAVAWAGEETTALSAADVAKQSPDS